MSALVCPLCATPPFRVMDVRAVADQLETEAARHTGAYARALRHRAHVLRNDADAIDGYRENLTSPTVCTGLVAPVGGRE